MYQSFILLGSEISDLKKIILPVKLQIDLMSPKKAVLKKFLIPEAASEVFPVIWQNVTKFTGKHLLQSFFFNKFAGLQLYLKNPRPVFFCEFCKKIQDTTNSFFN